MWKSKIIYPLLVCMFFLGTCESFGKPIAVRPSPKGQKVQNTLSQNDIDSFKKNLSEVSNTSNSVQQRGSVQKVNTLGSNCLIAPGDNLSVSVYGESDLNQIDIMVRADGNATIQPFGEMRAAGMTVAEFTALVTNRLKKYLLDPKVSIKIDNQKIAKVYIYGSVYKPGVYEHAVIPTYDPITGRTVSSAPDLTVASVISKCGGVQYNADLRHVKIVSRGGVNEKTIDLMNLIATGDSSQDVFLQPGDSIYVPQLNSGAQISDEDFKLISASSLSPATFSVKVMGEVKRPGVVSMTSINPEISAAIAATEGFTRDARRAVVKVRRLTPAGNISTMSVNPEKQNFLLRPGDLVVVQTKFGGKLSRFMGPISDVLSPLVGIGTSARDWSDALD